MQVEFGPKNLTVVEHIIGDEKIPNSMVISSYLKYFLVGEDAKTWKI